MHDLVFNFFTASLLKAGSAVLTVLASVAVLSACSKEAPVASIQYDSKAVTVDGKKHFNFLVHPMYNPLLLHQKYEPIMAYLDRHMPGTAFDLETANDYADFERKLNEHKADFALPNPYHAMLAQDWGYHVIAKMGDDSVFKGIFIVRNDSPIKVPADLKGKVVAYPAPTALAAAMMPQLYLQKHGVDVQTEITNRYVGTHNSSIMNAYLKQSAASATWPTAWKAFVQSNPAEASQLRVIWETPTLIQNAIIVRKEVPQDVSAKLAQLLTTLQDSDEGRNLLSGIDTQDFVAASDQDFDVVRRFLKEYNAAVKKQK
jgi:phosphonate transport system substrate-binding protein